MRFMEFNEENYKKSLYKDRMANFLIFQKNYL